METVRNMTLNGDVEVKSGSHDMTTSLRLCCRFSSFFLLELIRPRQHRWFGNLVNLAHDRYIALRCSEMNPFRAPKPLLILIPSNFVSKTGFQLLRRWASFIDLYLPEDRKMRWSDFVFVSVHGDRCWSFVLRTLSCVECCRVSLAQENHG